MTATEPIPQAPDKMGIVSKFSYPLILYELVKATTLQALKLPHETVIMNINEPLGTTEEDIIYSIDRGVKMLHATLDPYFDATFREEYTLIANKWKEIKRSDIREFYANSMEHLACLMRLMDRKRMLLTEDEQDIMDEIAGDVVYGCEENL